MKSRMMHFVRYAGAVATMTLATSAMAQPGAEGALPARVPLRASITESVVTTLLFGIIGIVLAILGFKLFDIATPFHLEREICEKQNLAVAIVCGSMILGICLIIAATVLS